MVLIIAAIIFFLLGYLTPVSALYTLPVSLVLLLYGIIRIMKKENGQARGE